MKYLPLIWAGLWRKKTRTILTMFSIVTAFFLFGMLQGINLGIDSLTTQVDYSLPCAPHAFPSLPLCDKFNSHFF